jgi:molybdopterin-guanine dinucleotide biosynthesis protein A
MEAWYTRAVTGVILAGGQSRRMGRDKALLPLAGRTLIEQVIARLRQACGERLLLVTNAPDAYRRLGLPMVPDALPPGQSLVGIYTGLLHAQEAAFVCACDLPCLNPALIRHLERLARDADVVIPRHGGEYEPLHAVYTPACLEPIRRCAERQGRNIGFLPEVRVRVVEEDELRRFDPDLRSFVNVNTPEDYEAVRACMESSGREAEASQR